MLRSGSKPACCRSGCANAGHREAGRWEVRGASPATALRRARSAAAPVQGGFSPSPPWGDFTEWDGAGKRGNRNCVKFAELECPASHLSRKSGGEGGAPSRSNLETLKP